MDPHSAYSVLWSDDSSPEEQYDAAIALLVWLAKGGVSPVGGMLRQRTIDRCELFLLNALDRIES